MRSSAVSDVWVFRQEVNFEMFHFQVCDWSPSSRFLAFQGLVIHPYYKGCQISQQFRARSGICVGSIAYLFINVFGLLKDEPCPTGACLWVLQAVLALRLGDCQWLLEGNQYLSINLLHDIEHIFLWSNSINLGHCHRCHRCQQGFCWGKESLIEVRNQILSCHIFPDSCIGRRVQRGVQVPMDLSHVLWSDGTSNRDQV